MALLDIGCGTGGFLAFARDAGYEVFGFDASLAQVQEAASHFPTVRCATSTDAYLDLLGQPKRRFDVVTLWDVLEHIREPGVFLDNLRKVLAPGGVVFASVPNGRAMLWKKHIYRALGRSIEDAWIPWEHVFYYSPRSLDVLASSVGMQVTKWGAVPCYPRPLSTFEVLRRAGFLALRLVPGYAPQIYAWFAA
jgi:cyclopropane fatty-acyl-phospholipid synthase-like methyltransferase